MAGTSDGAKKAAQTNKITKGSDYYKKIGSSSWKNPSRSRKTGFALLSKDQASRVGREAARARNEKIVYDTKIKEPTEYYVGDDGVEELRAIFAEDEETPTCGFGILSGA